jgi:hypothetical protein
MDHLEELFNKAKASEGYMVSLSTITQGRLEHSLVMEKFNKLDMLISNKKIKNLIIEQLEDEREEAPLVPEVVTLPQ